MPAYYIASHIIKDAELFERYRLAAAKTIADFGGRYISKAGSHQVLFGNWQPERVVIIEFDDMQAFHRWYESSDYQALIELRKSAAIDSMIVVDGI